MSLPTADPGFTGAFPVAALFSSGRMGGSASLADMVGLPPESLLPMTPAPIQGAFGFSEILELLRSLLAGMVLSMLPLPVLLPPLLLLPGIVLLPTLLLGAVLDAPGGVTPLGKPSARAAVTLIMVSSAMAATLAARRPDRSHAPIRLSLPSAYAFPTCARWPAKLSLTAVTSSSASNGLVIRCTVRYSGGSTELSS